MTIQLDNPPPTKPGEFIVEWESLGIVTRALVKVERDQKELRLRNAGARFDTKFIQKHNLRTLPKAAPLSPEYLESQRRFGVST